MKGWSRKVPPSGDSLGQTRPRPHTGCTSSLPKCRQISNKHASSTWRDRRSENLCLLVATSRYVKWNGRPKWVFAALLTWSKVRHTPSRRVRSGLSDFHVKRDFFSSYDVRQISVLRIILALHKLLRALFDFVVYFFKVSGSSEDATTRFSKQGCKSMS